MLCLEKDPEANAKNLSARLRSGRLSRFNDAYRRMPQHRVKDWRGVMARILVHVS